MTSPIPTALIQTEAVLIIGALVVFTLPGFLLARWALPKIVGGLSPRSTLIASIIAGIVLSPFLAYGAFVVVAIASRFHG
ncbi:MAG TPA: hypothetical protein VFE50_09900 [Cyclobacteriaceae bacterium]|nr:hypothetical protein [Cyclobacteriaceae bacterium]